MYFVPRTEAFAKWKEKPSHFSSSIFGVIIYENISRLYSSIAWQDFLHLKASFLLLSIELLNSEEVATNKRWKQVQRAVKCGINKVVLIPVCLSS